MTPDSGICLRGGIVAYDAAVKFDLLSVPAGPVVNERTAIEMATGACELFGADVGLSTTGVLGPATADGQPIGTLWVGVAIGDHAHARCVDLPVREGQSDVGDAAHAAVRVLLTALERETSADERART
jgi:PncC family amidohydrolase